MARKKTSLELSLEAVREKEKQARFQKVMKAEGYKRVTLWGLPGTAHE